MATKVDDDVIENINADVGSDNHAIELEDVQPTTKPEVNGQYNNNSNHNGDKTNSGKGGTTNPLQYPKIFIALLVVLIIAVIALSFVLHSVDNKVTESNGAKVAADQNKKALLAMQDKIAGLQKENKELKKQVEKVTTMEGGDHAKIGTLNKTQIALEKKQADVSVTLDDHYNRLTVIDTKIKDQTKNVEKLDKGVAQQKVEVEDLTKKLNATKIKLNSATDNLTKLQGSVAINKNSISSVTSELKKSKDDITNLGKKTSGLTTSVDKNTQDIGKHGDDIKKMNTSIGENKDKAVALGVKLGETNTKLDTSNKNITALNGQTKGLETLVKKNTGDVKNVDRFFHQLNMKIQYNKGYQEKIGMTFKEILALTGEEDKVEKTEPIITKLLKQQKEFEKYKDQWKITIKDIARLTNGSELKGGGSLNTIKKLIKLNDGYKVKNTKWNITFQDVIRLTTREDMKDILIKEEINTIAILGKIDQLYDAFKPHESVWKIHFKDVVDLTMSLNFTDATKCPALVKVKSWYVPGFTDVWGESFDSFFHIMKDQSASKQAELLGKIQAVAEKEKKKRFLKMLPATFEYDGKKLSVHGYIQVFYNGRTGTVWINGTTPHFHITEATVTTLCAVGGYSYTRDGWSDGKYRDGKGYDRSKLRCLISGLQCLGTGMETNLDTCNKDPIVDPTTRSPTTARASTAIPTTTPAATTKPTVTTKNPAPTKKPTVSTKKPTVPTKKTTVSKKKTTVPKKKTTVPKKKTTVPTKKTTVPKQNAVPAVAPLLGWDHSEDLAIKCNL